MKNAELFRRRQIAEEVAGALLTKAKQRAKEVDKKSSHLPNETRAIVRAYNGLLLWCSEGYPDEILWFYQYGSIPCRQRVSMFDEDVNIAIVLLKDKGKAALAAVESQRTLGGKTSIERRYFISSLSGIDAETIGRMIRSHWGVENKLHWTLDVSFGEDRCRIRKDCGAENFSRLRRIALNLLKQEKTAKCGVKAKQHKAGWDGLSQRGDCGGADQSLTGGKF